MVIPDNDDSPYSLFYYRNSRDTQNMNTRRPGSAPTTTMPSPSDVNRDVNGSIGPSGFFSSDSKTLLLLGITAIILYRNNM